MFQEIFKSGRRSQGRTGKSWHQVRQTITAIESAFEFRQVTRRIFRIKRVIIAAQGCLEIAQHRIDLVKMRFFHGGIVKMPSCRCSCVAEMPFGLCQKIDRLKPNGQR